jgi:hypothetical protein
VNVYPCDVASGCKVKVKSRKGSGAVKTRVIFACLTIGVALCAAAPTLFANPQAGQQTTADEQTANNISAAADKQCSGKEGKDADECRVKTLWDLAHCPPLANSGFAPENCTHAPGGFEYEVASIKLHKDGGGQRFISYNTTPDGLDIRNMAVSNLVMNAYSTGLKIEISGGPGWMSDETYDVSAKFDSEVGDALNKLRGAERAFVRRYMLQNAARAPGA